MVLPVGSIAPNWAPHPPKAGSGHRLQHRGRFKSSMGGYEVVLSSSLSLTTKITNYFGQTAQIANTDARISGLKLK